MKNYYICNECGERIPADEVVFMGDIPLCEHCADRLSVRCRCCGRRIWEYEAVVDGDLCESCFERNYTTCEDCGAIIPYSEACYTDDDDGEEYPYCDSCIQKHNENRVIHDYYYKPSPEFYGVGKLYMGVELEIDEGGEDEYYAERLLDIANDQDVHMYIKHDGSLDNGFEMVTHPMTLEYHKTRMPWEKVLKRAISCGYRSHQANTCGLHVHVSREALGRSYSEIEEAIGRLVYFYEKFWVEMLRFSRRTESQANRWASRYGGVLSTCKESLDTAKKAGLGRYTAVNLANYNTVEFRIFRGTLRLDTLLATLEFTQYLCKLASETTDDDFHNLTWLDFVKGIDADIYPELIDYLKRRRLYVNEPVSETEEI